MFDKMCVYESCSSYQPEGLREGDLPRGLQIIDI